jgi:murein DD-endopeptidase MepM/ murein hydrolase activator NlpD
VEITKSKLEERKRSLERASREKETLMADIALDIEAFEKEYDKLNDFAKQIESKIVKLQKNTGPYSGGKMAWPVPGYSRISSPYGYRIHPIFKVKKLHTGIDIPAPTGTAITAAAAGTVIYSDWLGGYGKVIMLDHGGGVVSLYAHNSALVLSEGQSVKRGDTISKAGSTGNSTGPHLHFEVRKNGAYVDPLPWLNGSL